ncbi:MAG: anti-sigma factor, partial [Bacteroidota bacterium]
LKEQILHQIQKNKIKSRTFFKYAIAASFAALVCAGSAFFFYNQNRALQQENSLVNNKIKNLEMDMKVQLEDLRNQYIVLNNPNTKRYTVKGNKKAKELKAVAYVNPVKKLSYINVGNLPELPEDQCFQMWAEVNGELVNLGVIKNYEKKDQLMALPYADNAIGYITIEPSGGNETPTVKNIVANIDYYRKR